MHVHENEIEQYVEGTISESDEARVEEHLLICDGCRERVREADAAVHAFRSASAELRDRARRWALPAFPMFWAAAAAAACLLMGAIVWHESKPGTTVAPLPIVLQSARGPETNTAPAGRPLSLTIDVSQLPQADSYRIEMLDTRGNRVVSTQQAPQDGKLSVSVKPAAGVYFIRVYSRELLREYALRVD